MTLHINEVSIKNFLSKCDQIPKFQRIWQHLLKKFFLGNLIFCVVWKRSLVTLNIMNNNDFQLGGNELSIAYGTAKLFLKVGAYE